MLLYIRETQINNPEIWVKAPRIFQKGYSIIEIADILEENEETIKGIVEKLKKCPKEEQNGICKYKRDFFDWCKKDMGNCNFL